MMQSVILVAAGLLLTACQSVPEQRVREAHLMPREIALAIVDKYTPRGFSANPTLPRLNSTNALCTDRLPKPVQFKDLSIRFGLNEVTLFTAYEPIQDGWCGKNVQGKFHVPNQTERDALVDAFIALGAQPN
jgi:hypothetical protein